MEDAQIPSHAYILGGAPCSGKSTLAERLSAYYGLQYYKVDDYQEVHLQRCRPDRHPVLWNYLGLSWEQRWMRPVAQQVEEVFHIFGERFEMLLEDLAGFDRDQPILLEGAALLPDLIARYPVKRDRTLFMVPTRAFQTAHYRPRPWVASILQECADPQAAFANWMERDHLFGHQLIRQADKYGYPVVVVDGSVTVDEQSERVSALWGLGMNQNERIGR